MIIAAKRLKQKGESDNGSVKDYNFYSLFISKTFVVVVCFNAFANFRFLYYREKEAGSANC